MKLKPLALSLCLSLVSLAAFSQEAPLVSKRNYFSVEVTGLRSAPRTVNGVAKPIFGFSAGFGLCFELQGNVSFRTGLNINQLGGDIELMLLNEEYGVLQKGYIQLTQNYINLPLALRFYLNKSQNFYAGGGVFFGVTTSAKERLSTARAAFDRTDAVSPYDAGFMLEAGGFLKLSETTALGLCLNYNKGMIETVMSRFYPNLDWVQQSFGLQLSVRTKIGK